MEMKEATEIVYGYTLKCLEYFGLYPEGMGEYGKVLEMSLGL